MASGQLETGSFWAFTLIYLPLITISLQLFPSSGRLTRRMLRPIDSAAWTLQAAAHLLNRAGFGGTPEDIDVLHRMGSRCAVDLLVDYERVPSSAEALEWAGPEPDRARRIFEMRTADDEGKRILRREYAKLQRDRIVELRYHWLNRMCRTRRPLEEKLTLFWHGHFATSAIKVRDAHLMWRHIETLRRHAAGRWIDMLDAVTRDPAMLLWLDQAASKPTSPNENYARELMELFTLGEGHYTEQDVSEAARALTGLGYDAPRQEYVYRRRQHDNSRKTIFGVSGRFDARELLELIVDQPSAPRFITSKLWRFFAGTNPEPALAEALAHCFVGHKLQFRPWLRDVFMSEEFHAPSLRQRQIKSPVQWLVMGCRQLERDLPPATNCSQILRQLGQELLAPPNVKGWEDGSAWITPGTLALRHQYARQWLMRPPTPEYARAFPIKEFQTPEALLEAIEGRLLSGTLREDERAEVLTILSNPNLSDLQRLRQAIALVLCAPEYQLT